MAYVKAEYLEALNKNTNQVEQVKFIPPSPEGDDLGGVSKKYIEATQKAIEELADKKITKFYASSQGNTHLPDSDKGKIQDMFLYGNLEQVQYKGKNLLNYTRGSTTVNGVTFTVNVNKTIIVNGTATKDAIFILTSNITKFFDKADSIKAIGCPSGGSISKFDLRVFVNNVGIFYDYGSGVVVNKTEETNSNVAIVVREGYTANNLVFKPMLTADTTVTYADYEPYTGGIPSPNPDYPQEIKAVVNPKVVVRGKNLFDKNNYRPKKYIVDEKGNLEDSESIYTTNDIYVKEGVTVSISNTGTKRRGYYNKDRTKFTYVNSNVSTLTVPEDCFLVISCNYDSTPVDKFQVEIGSIATSYQPYTEQSITLPYTLYAIPVTTGGNITIENQKYVADYVDVERGKLVRNVKHKVLIGTENYNTNTDWKTGTWTVSNWTADGKTVQNHALVTDIISPSAIKNAASQIANGVIGIGATKNDLFLNFGTEYTTATKIKEYIAQNNVDVYYILATPEEIDLTPDQIQAFKSLATNYPVTNIEVSSDQLDGYTVFNYPISMAEGWNYVKQQIGDTRDYIYDMDLQSAEAYVNSEYAVALSELEVM